MGRTVTMRGNPLNLEGPEIKVGDPAPDASLQKGLGADCPLSEFKGRRRILSVIPSIDTPVCADQTRRFHEEVGKLKGVAFITISCDLPVAQMRFCGAENLKGDAVTMLSDHKTTDFGKRYGVLLPDMRILCRAVFVVGPDDVIRYAEYVPEIADYPNYEAVISCVKAL